MSKACSEQLHVTTSDNSLFLVIKFRNTYIRVKLSAAQLQLQ